MNRPFDNPSLCALWEHWQSARAGRRAPSFDDLSLTSLGPAADFILLVERAGARFRYLSVGAAIQRIYGYPMDGLYLDAALPATRLGPAVERYTRVCESGRPALARNAYEISSRLRFVVERLLLPLAGRDGGIAGVICGQIMQAALDGAPLGPATESRATGDHFLFLDPDPSPLGKVAAG